MSQSFRNDAPALARDWGIVFPDSVTHYANDALPTAASVTVANSGIPVIFTTYTDPMVVKAIITPIESEAIYGTAKKGDWLTDVSQFAFVEFSGYVSSYDDYSQDGTSDPNANWPQRQSYHYQVWTKWGEREVDRMGAAKMDWVNQKNLASISVLNKAQNIINLFGVSGMQNYGALNDPFLPAAITPTPKFNPQGTAVGTAWNTMSDPFQVYADFLAQFAQLQIQVVGNVKMNSPMTWVIPSERVAALGYTNQFGFTVADLIKKSFPNLKIETLPEAGTALGGGFATVTMSQLFLDSVDGQETRTTAFTEKMRAHAVERYSSNFRQKKSQGSWGTIWFYPIAVVEMVGI